MRRTFISRQEEEMRFLRLWGDHNCEKVQLAELKKITNSCFVIFYDYLNEIINHSLSD